WRPRSRRGRSSRATPPGADVPELPEVEVVRLGIARAVTGATVTTIEVFEPRSLRRHPAPPEDFVARLTGAVFAAPERRGKFLWLPLGPPVLHEMQERADAVRETSGKTPSALTESPAFRSVEASHRTTGEALVVHLGMSGQVLLRGPAV